MHTHLCTHPPTPMHMCAHTHTHVRAAVHTPTPMHTCAHTHTHVRAAVHTRPAHTRACVWKGGQHSAPLRPPPPEPAVCLPGSQTAVQHCSSQETFPRARTACTWPGSLLLWEVCEAASVQADVRVCGCPWVKAACSVQLSVHSPGPARLGFSAFSLPSAEQRLCWRPPVSLGG